MYHVALQRCSGSAAMHELYAVFLQQHAEVLTVRLTKLEQQQQQAARAAGKTAAAKQERKQLRIREKCIGQQLTEAVTLLEAACSEAAQQGCASEQVLLAWPAAALRAGRAQAALQAARSACQALPASAGVWEQRLKLEGQRLSLQVGVPACRSLPALMMSCGVLLAQLLFVAVAASSRHTCVCESNFPKEPTGCINVSQLTRCHCLQVDKATQSSMPAPATPDGLPVGTATGSSDDDESGSIAEASPVAAARSAAVQEFARLAQQALTAVPPAASHSLWLLALQFTSQLGDPGLAGGRPVGSALKCLLQLLETTTAAQGKGPLRVGEVWCAAVCLQSLAFPRAARCITQTGPGAAGLALPAARLLPVCCSGPCPAVLGASTGARPATQLQGLCAGLHSGAEVDEVAKERL